MTERKDDNLPARLVPPEPGTGGRSHWRVTPLGLALVEELAGRGVHVATIARALGMSKDAFRSCRDRQPEVDDAYHAGLAREHDALVSNLREAADGGNIVANIFLLKARHQYREGSATGPREARAQKEGYQLMPLFLVTRPKGAEHLKNPATVHAALVDAADGPAAVLAANALMPNLNTPFEGFDSTQVAATAAGDFIPCVFQGDALGATYAGPGRGA